MKTKNGWLLCAFVLVPAIFIFIDSGRPPETRFVSVDTSAAYAARRDTPVTKVPLQDTTAGNEMPSKVIDTRQVQPQQVVAYAKTLVGTRYQYASADPATGFDCSGFITYVFQHFHIAVPRSSRDFTEVGTEVTAAAARPGDLVLFTGTDSTEKFVGHMGLVVSNDSSSLQFIHSSSGKAHGVVITPMNDYYRSRYVKTVRIF